MQGDGFAGGLREEGLFRKHTAAAVLHGGIGHMAVILDRELQAARCGCGGYGGCAPIQGHRETPLQIGLVGLPLEPGVGGRVLPVGGAGGVGVLHRLVIIQPGVEAYLDLGSVWQRIAIGVLAVPDVACAAPERFQHTVIGGLGGPRVVLHVVDSPGLLI